MQVFSVLHFHTKHSLFRFISRHSHKFTWPAQLCCRVEMQTCYSYLFYSRLPLIFVLISLLSNLSVPLSLAAMWAPTDGGTKLFTNADIWRWRTTTRIALRFCRALWTSSSQNVPAGKKKKSQQGKWNIIWQKQGIDYFFLYPDLVVMPYNKCIDFMVLLNSN